MLSAPLRAAGVLLITLLTFYFPGRTYLQSDTQIYVPMLEHLVDPSALSADLSATRPHLAYTLYDESAIALHRLPGASWQSVLLAQQFLCRAAGVLGLFLLFLALGLPDPWAFLAAAWASLGAVISGPAVLTIEYEPVPRGFAIGLLLLALGLAARNRLLPASFAAAAAFLYHPPTAAVVWLVFIAWTIYRRQFRALLPLAAAVVILAVAARLQPGQTEHQALFGRIAPALEQLQLLRAPYNWVSHWDWRTLCQFPLLCAVSLAALFRLKPSPAPRWFLASLPLLGLLSIPLSWLLLEGLHWTLIPQFQPARAVLWITLAAVDHPLPPPPSTPPATPARSNRPPGSSSSSPSRSKPASSTCYGRIPPPRSLSAAFSSPSPSPPPSPRSPASPPAPGPGPPPPLSPSPPSSPSPHSAASKTIPISTPRTSPSSPPSPTTRLPHPPSSFSPKPAAISTLASSAPKPSAPSTSIGNPAAKSISIPPSASNGGAAGNKRSPTRSARRTSPRTHLSASITSSSTPPAPSPVSPPFIATPASSSIRRAPPKTPPLLLSLEWKPAPPPASPKSPPQRSPTIAPPPSRAPPPAPPPARR